MDIVANGLNNEYPIKILSRMDKQKISQIDLAVAYVRDMDEIFKLATDINVPLNLYALADGHGFPSLKVARYDSVFVPAEALAVASGTVALWHFNEGDGNTTLDETAYANDGILHGPTWTER